MLEGRNLTFSYLKDDLVLENVSIQVKTGRIQTVLGPNGSGKTTLLLLVSGLLRPLSGEVLLDGKNLFEMLPGARRYIGIMFQNPDDHLFSPTVRDELLFTLSQLELTRGEVEAKIQLVANMLHLEHLLNKPIHALSFGEKRRVALASIIIYDPTYLLLDEPFANLDPKTTALFLKLLCNLRKSRGILLASQDVALAERISDYVYILSNKKIIWEGEPPVPRNILDEAGLQTEMAPCSFGQSPH